MNVDEDLEYVMLGRDNEFARFLLSDGTPLDDLSNIQKVQLLIDGRTLDSSQLPAGTITWDQTAEWRAGVSKPVITFKLGLVEGANALEEGIARGGKLITFDPENPDGLEWTRSINLEVRA